MPNEQAKEKAADIRADGYKARIDTWQGQFAVWSDKGLTDPTMPVKAGRAPTVRRGRAPTKPSLQRAFDELVKDMDTPPKKFEHEGKTWSFEQQIWSDKEQQRLRERFAKKGFDSAVISFKGRGYILYISKWDTPPSPKHQSEDYVRATGLGKKSPVGVSGILRGKKAPRTKTHRGKKYTRHSCHLNVGMAKDEAKELSEEFYTVLYQSGVGTICVYIRVRTRRKLPKKAEVQQEVFGYLDRLHKAGVTPERMIPILMEMYGMTELTAKNLVSRWTSERKIGEKPATHPGRKQVSKGVYTTKRERKELSKSDSRPASRRSKEGTKLLDATAIGTTRGMADRAEAILGVQVDEVYAVRQFGDNKDLLIMIRSGSVIKIYEVLRGRTSKTKRKYVQRNLVDKFSASVTKDGRERAFRKEASRRGIQ